MARAGIVSLLLIIAVISLAATVHADAAGDRAEDRQAGVTLTTGEIDSSTVAVGAFAVVIHGLGERQPDLGAWESLATSRGYIQAIDAETLVLGMGANEWPEMIALERIETLVLPGTSVLEGVDRDSTAAVAADAAAVAEPTPSRAAEDSVQATGSRRQVIKYSHRQPWREERDIGFAFKCGIGAYVGILSAVAGFLIFLPFIECADPDGGQEPLIFCNEWAGPPMQAAKIGFLAGTASGVTLVDPYRKFTYLYALAGSWVGLQVARELADRVNDGKGYASLGIHIGVPAVMAALASEGMRGFHEERRFSVGLTPGRRGSLSAVATLRF